MYSLHYHEENWCMINWIALNAVWRNAVMKRKRDWMSTAAGRQVIFVSKCGSVKLHEAEMVNSSETDWRKCIRSYYEKRKFFSELCLHSNDRSEEAWGIGGPQAWTLPNRGLEIQECWLKGILKVGENMQNGEY